MLVVICRLLSDFRGSLQSHRWLLEAGTFLGLERRWVLAAVPRLVLPDLQMLLLLRLGVP